MNKIFKATSLIPLAFIIGCGSDNNDENNLDLERSSESELSITVTQETFDSTTPIKQYTLLYDISGNQLSEIYDADNDGINDRAHSYYYDAEGRLEIASYDNDGDGILDIKRTYSVNDLVRTESLYYDYDADGIFDRIIVYTSGEYGYPLFSESIDDNGDGIFNNITEHEYDENNYRISTSHDYDGDGIYDEVTEYTPSQEGGGNNNPPQDSEDYNSIDRAYTYAYNSNYDLISRTIDNNGDGIADEISNYVYNDDGQLSSESHDYDADGTPERLAIFDYSELGNVLTERITDEYDGTTTITFNDKGVKIEITYDSNNDGNIERKINYSYSGNLTILDSLYISEYFNWN